MRPVLVIVLDVVAKDCIEMTTAKNERPVEALFPDGPYPPLRDRVRVGRADGRPDLLDAFGDEHLVEAGGELRVTVSDEELKGPTLLSEIACEVTGNLGDEGAGRMIGDPEDVDCAAPRWKYSAEQSEDRSVRGPVADAAMELPLEQADLVAKHHQLDVLVQSCPPAGSQHLKNAARDEIAETEAHGR